MSDARVHVSAGEDGRVAVAVSVTYVCMCVYVVQRARRHYRSTVGQLTRCFGSKRATLWTRYFPAKQYHGEIHAP